MNEDLSCLRGMFKEQKIHIDYRFDELHKDIGEIKVVNEKQDEEIETLRNRKWKDRSYAAGGGVIGGFLAYFATKAKVFFNGM